MVVGLVVLLAHVVDPAGDDEGFFVVVCAFFHFEAAIKDAAGMDAHFFVVVVVDEELFSWVHGGMWVV